MNSKRSQAAQSHQASARNLATGWTGIAQNRFAEEIAALQTPSFLGTGSTQEAKSEVNEPTAPPTPFNPFENKSEAEPAPTKPLRYLGR